MGISSHVQPTKSVVERDDTTALSSTVHVRVCSQCYLLQCQPYPCVLFTYMANKSIPQFFIQPRHPNSTQLISPNILALTRQRLKYPRWQLIPNQARKHHEVLGFLQQLVRQYPAHLVVVRASEQVLAVARTTADAPQQNVANVACDFSREGAEAVGRGADFAEVALGAEREDLEVLDALWREGRLVYGYIREKNGRNLRRERSCSRRVQ
jgi:hypothetical protein